MVIGVRHLDLHFSAPQSLKEKRMILKSMVVRIRREYNVAVAELDGMDLWQRSHVAIAAVGNERKFVHHVLDLALEMVKENRDVEVLTESLEMF